MSRAATLAKPALSILLVWPVRILWRLVTCIANLTGIILALILGMLFMVIGLALTASFIGAILGIPLFILGFLLLLRGLY